MPVAEVVRDEDMHGIQCNARSRFAINSLRGPAQGRPYEVAINRVVRGAHINIVHVLVLISSLHRGVSESREARGCQPGPETVMLSMSARKAFNCEVSPSSARSISIVA